MPEMLGIVIGYIAMCCTVVAFVPQTLRCWRTRQTRDVALFTWLLTGAGALFWALYSYHVHSLPILITNVIVISGCASIVIAKLRYG